MCTLPKRQTQINSIVIMKEYDIAIVGAGPSGIMAAIAAARNSDSVVLLEKNSRPGLKLLLTGAGRCNITNLKPIKKLLTFYDEKNFLKHSFYTFTNEDLLDMFRDKGLSFTVEDNDRVFPSSGKSSDILEILLSYLEGVSITYNFEVKSISDDFIINNKIKTNKIIIATGGITYPKTGTSPKNYFLTPHPVTDIKYGLVPLITKKDLSSIAGVVLENVGITYHKKIRENVLFSHVGISGPGIIDISNEVSKSLNYNLLTGGADLNFTVDIDLCPDLTFDEINEKFSKDFHDNPKKQLKNYLKQFIPKSFIKFFTDEVDVQGEIQISQINRKTKNRIIQYLKKFPFEIVDFNGDLSKVTIGGVDLKYVNSKTMESKIIPNLYFAGEVLNLHGPTGGYNLKIAFSTGYLAGLSASQ